MSYRPPKGCRCKTKEANKGNKFCLQEVLTNKGDRCCLEGGAKRGVLVGAFSLGGLSAAAYPEVA